MDNLGEIHRFLKIYNFPKLNQEELENLNRPIKTNEIEAAIKKLPANKSHGLDDFTGEFYQTLKEELTCIILKLFQKSQKKGRHPSSFCKASIILIPEPDKDTTKRHCKPISLTNRY